MKTIASLIVVAMLTLPAIAFPDDFETNPDVCKLFMDSGKSMSIVYAWQNPTTGLWEARLGYGAYNGPVMLPITFSGDMTGTVSIDLTDIAASATR